MSVSIATQKELWSLAGNQCAFPGCQQELVDPEIAEDGESRYGVIAQVAHIRSEKPNGPRYDKNFPTDKLDRAGNLILLCRNHHGIVDGKNGKNFSVDDLLKMKKRHQEHHARRAKLNDAINAYIGGRYFEEDELKFQQASLRVPSVEATFVDVVAGVSPASPLGSLFRKIQENAAGDPEVLQDPTGDIAVGGAQALLHPKWRGHVIITGGPGQGKSTLLQYICQFHRAKRLGKSEYQESDAKMSRADTMARVPIRVDLKKYAQWAARQEGVNFQPEILPDDDESTPELPNLEKYLLSEINQGSGVHDFDKDDFVALLATEPVLLALDGLDEVANIYLREGVLAQIRSMHGRLQAEAVDLSIIVATRPGSSLETLTGTGDFPVMKLKRLSHGLRMQYLDKWVKHSKLESVEVDRLRSIFSKNANLPHIQELAAYPMQLAILLDLLNRKQLLPQKRADLYRSYLETFLDREEAQDKEPLLSEHRQLLELVHSFIGWYLHCRAEDGTNAGTITRDELHRLLQEHLADHRQDLQLAERIFRSISTRWLCLVEREEGVYEFEVQSLQEYFAALYMFENLTPRGKTDSRDHGLMEMLARPYWTNVCRFFIGHFGNSEVRALRENLSEVEEQRHPYPPIRSMGLLALNDRTFDSTSDKVKRRMVEFILQGDGVLYSEDGLLEGAADRVEFGKNAGRDETIAYLKSRLIDAEDDGLRPQMAKILRRHADDNDELHSWWRTNFRTELSWLEVGVRLGTLRSLAPELEDDLAAKFADCVRPQGWVTRLLARGGLTGSEKSLQFVKSELNDGGVNAVDPPSSSSPLSTLIRQAGVATLHSGVVSKSQRGGTDPGATYQVLRSTQSCTEQLQGIDTASERLDDWGLWLSAIHDAWGDGWIIRMAISATPQQMDLSSLSLRVRSERPGLSRLIASEASYRDGVRDQQWWVDRLAEVENDLDKRWWLVKLLTSARFQVIEGLAESTNRLVTELDPKHYAAVEGALSSVAARSAVRAPIDLRAILRTNASTWNGPALWLLRIVATDSSQVEIGRALRQNLNAALRAGALDPGSMMVAVDTGNKKINLEDLQFARSALSTAEWDVTRVRIPNSKEAKEILSQPLDWPRQLVLQAADVRARALAKQLHPMSKVAADNNWFVE